MLPSSCLTHSRNITTASFRLILTEKVGFGVVEERWTPKVAFFVLRAEGEGKVGEEEEGGGGGGGGKEGRGKKGSSWAKDFDVVL